LHSERRRTRADIVRAMRDSVTVHTSAPSDKIWALVSDVANTSKYAEETFEAEWLDGATAPEVGVRFRGHVLRNGRPPAYWASCKTFKDLARETYRGVLDDVGWGRAEQLDFIYFGNCAMHGVKQGTCGWR
jgi:hypothetical protein